MEGRGGWLCRRHGEGHLSGYELEDCSTPSLSASSPPNKTSELKTAVYTAGRHKGPVGLGCVVVLRNPGKSAFGPPEPENAGPTDRRRKEPGDSLTRATLGSSAVMK